MKFIARNINNNDEYFITSDDSNIQNLLVEMEREAKLRSWDGYVPDAYTESEVNHVNN